MKQLLLALTFIFCTVLSFSQSAQLKIQNNSQRTLSIKVMTSSNHRHSFVTVSPWSNQTIYFASTGNFYLKTKATIQGKEPMFSKGKPFQVYVGSDGYSVLTITYSIKESAYSADPLDGKKISKEEFDKD
ncbi:MAG: hypothetical protein JNK66_09225 [Chitinophagales bacterium]|nr:hypothetical protein [Chitinophagales bacterium]